MTTQSTPARRVPDPVRPAPEGIARPRAAHTPNFPALLRPFGASLLVTTTQAGQPVLVREDGDHLNTHSRTFPAPMGLAVGGGRLAVGTLTQVWEYVNVPAVAARPHPPGRHAAAYRAHSCHFTGDIQGRGLASDAGGDLWVVDTRFSYLCTLDRSASFTPRWRPPFVSELEPSDRSHLNGLGMVDGRPRYGTALGATDAPAGWRADKARGVVLDIDSGEVVARGLSMLHTPRWHAARLWLCESGSGTLSTVDPATGRSEPVAGLHPRPRLRRLVAGAGGRVLQRHPAHRPAGRARADMPGRSRRSDDRARGRSLAISGRSTRDFCGGSTIARSLP